jgi:hypothetical protein
MADFNLDDLGNIEVNLRGIVDTVSKYDIDDANKGGFLWLTKPNNGENPNILGNQIIKVTMPFEMFQYCQDQCMAGNFSIPGVFEIRASVISGSGNKSGHKALAIKQIARLKITAESISDSSTSSSKSEKSKPISSMPDLKA